MFSTKIRWHKLNTSQEVLEERIALNRGLAFHVGGKKICIARNKEGFFAMADKCPHQGASMSGGVCSDEGYLECPWHKYRFDLRSGRDRAGAGDYLDVYPLDFREDGVYVGMEYLAFTLFDRKK